MSGAIGGCDFQATLLRVAQDFEGGGFYVLSEYSIDGQGFRFGDEKNGVVLHPVIYQFCANWDETKREVPPKFDEINKFCGVRFMFQSETREELRAQARRPRHQLRPRARETDREIRAARQLRAARPGGHRNARRRHHRPEGAQVQHLALVPRARCSGLHTACTASVVLSLEPATGVGTVLYSTPLLWEFAYARENNGYKGDQLFKMLHARD